MTTVFLLAFPAAILAAGATSDSTPADDEILPWSNMSRTRIRRPRGIQFADWRGPYTVPGWSKHNSQGGDITFSSITDENNIDIVVMHIDNPKDSNAGYYCIGKNIQRKSADAYVVEQWLGPYKVPGWFGHQNAGGGVAMGHLRNYYSNDIVIFHVDDPKAGNSGYYRVGFGMDTHGAVKDDAWSPVYKVPGWFGDKTSGSGIALAGIREEASWDLVVTHVDDPKRGNGLYYRVGFGLNAHGKVTGGWSNPMRIPGWVGYYSEGASIEVYDTNESGNLDLIVMHIDNPRGQNYMFYRIGFSLDKNGVVRGGWSKLRKIPVPLGHRNRGGGLALTHFVDGFLTMGAFYIHHPPSTKGGFLVYGSEVLW